MPIGPGKHTSEIIIHAVDRTGGGVPGHGGYIRDNVRVDRIMCDIGLGPDEDEPTVDIYKDDGEGPGRDPQANDLRAQYRASEFCGKLGPNADVAAQLAGVSPNQVLGHEATTCIICGSDVPPGQQFVRCGDCSKRKRGGDGDDD